MANGTDVSCPFKDCAARYRNAKSFRSHILRKHNEETFAHLKHSYYHDPNDISLIQSQSAVMNVIESTTTDDDCRETSPLQCLDGNSVPENELVTTTNHIDMMLRTIALFYLKLEAKYLVPSSTIAIISRGINEILLLNQHNVENCVSKVFDDIERDLSDGCNIDLNGMKHQLHKSVKCTSLTLIDLKSDHRRSKAYKELFKYAAPKRIKLGLDHFCKPQYCYYVSIIDTLKNLLSNTSVFNECATPQSPSGSNWFRGIFDGKCLKSNNLFSDSNAIKIILYQDCFEVCNPLGSSKGVHKLLGIYFTLGNFLPHHRSSVDHMQLVLLCKEKNIKCFSFTKVLKPLVNDLQQIEDIGIVIKNTAVKGSLLFIVGDNLGSHQIGGFTENFSRSLYWCRYCLLKSTKFHVNPLASAESRTPSNYSSALKKINEKKTLQAIQQSNSIVIEQGIKKNSIFNKLKYYHVCQNGLPPCLGHDMFEGFIRHDVALYLWSLIQKGWFTNNQLNLAIANFGHKLTDVNNKPPSQQNLSTLKKTQKQQGLSKLKIKKICGEAIQIWCFVRLLPLYLQQFIVDENDQVWKTILLLRKIIEMVCAPQLHLRDIAYLGFLIDDYLQYRVILYPHINLLPKHHYFKHYPSLILSFGPLINVWGMRFESKHSYFKRCARHCKNFKNICHTLSNKHAALQSYMVSSSKYFSPILEVSSQTFIFNSALYPSDVVDCIHLSITNLSSINICGQVIFKGTKYVCGSYLVTKIEELPDFTYSVYFGEIIMILVDINKSISYFVFKCVISRFDQKTGCYLIPKVSKDIYHCCLTPLQLFDYFPLPAYEAAQHNYYMIPMKHHVSFANCVSH
jgi:hypothetical protein